MITEQEVKAKVTPEIIKKMCELAEGFELRKSPHGNVTIIDFMDDSWIIIDNKMEEFPVSFPLLIHRAVEGWNKAKISYRDGIIIYDSYIELWLDGFNKEYDAKTYRPDSLTALECALLDCLVEVLG